MTIKIKQNKTPKQRTPNRGDNLTRYTLTLGRLKATQSVRKIKKIKD